MIALAAEGASRGTPSIAPASTGLDIVINKSVC